MSAILVPNRLLPQMVARNNHGYYDDEEPSFRRYRSRGQGYALSHDREPPSGHGHNVYSRSHMGGRDSRNGDRASENEEIPRARSRIPVAVSRLFETDVYGSWFDGVISVVDAGSERSDAVETTAVLAPTARALAMINVHF